MFCGSKHAIYSGLKNGVVHLPVTGNIDIYRASNVPRRAYDICHASAFTYDCMNRLSSVTDPLGTHWDNAYDRMGNVVSHMPSYSDADTFVHDALGRVTQMTSPAGSFTCSYNAASLVTWQAFNDGRVNTYAYDAAYRLTEAATGTNGQTLASYTYQYDALGNLTNVSSGGSTAPATVLSYAYDAANQTATLIATPFSDYPMAKGEMVKKVQTSYARINSVKVGTFRKGADVMIEVAVAEVAFPANKAKAAAKANVTVTLVGDRDLVYAAKASKAGFYAAVLPATDLAALKPGTYTVIAEAALGTDSGAVDTAILIVN